MHIHKRFRKSITISQRRISYCLYNQLFSSLIEHAFLAPGVCFRLNFSHLRSPCFTTTHLVLQIPDAVPACVNAPYHPPLHHRICKYSP
jgi:hypothetical protein